MRRVLAMLRLGWRGANRFRWRGLTIAWFIALAAWFAILVQPGVYEAHARFGISVEPISIDTSYQGSYSDIDDIRKIVLADDFLKRVLTDTHTGASPVDVANLKSNISVRHVSSGVTGAIHEISVIRSAPDNAVRTLESIVENLGSSTNELAASVHSRNVRSRDRDLELYSNRLSQAQRRLEEYVSENAGLFPVDGRSPIDRLGDQIRILNGLQARLQASVDEYNKVLLTLNHARQNSIPRNNVRAAENARISSIDSDIADLERQRVDLLRRFTERHPDVIAIQARIDRLDAERKSITEVSMPAAESNGLRTGRDFSELEETVEQLGTRVANDRQAIEAKQQQITALRNQLNASPQIMAKHARLSDEVFRAQESLRLLMATGDELRSTDQTNDAEFLTIDIEQAPRLAIADISYRRTFMLIGVFLVASILGVMVSLAFDMITPVFRSIAALHRIRAGSVLGAVDLVDVENAKANSGWSGAAFVIVAISFVLTLTVLVWLQDASSYWLRDTLLAGRSL